MFGVSVELGLLLLGDGEIMDMLPLFDSLNFFFFVTTSRQSLFYVDYCLTLGHYILLNHKRNYTFCWNFKYEKMQKIWFLFTRPLKIFFSKTNQHILHTNCPWVTVIKV